MNEKHWLAQVLKDAKKSAKNLPDWANKNQKPEKIMKPEKQRIEIAKFCGWKRAPAFDFYTTKNNECWELNGELRTSEKLPDYLNDRNAIHEVERKLTFEQSEKYIEHLTDIVQLPQAWIGTARGMFIIRYASPEKCLKAALLTIGKWEEE